MREDAGSENAKDREREERERKGNNDGLFKWPGAFFQDNSIRIKPICFLRHLYWTNFYPRYIDPDRPGNCIFQYLVDYNSFRRALKMHNVTHLFDANSSFAIDRFPSLFSILSRAF